MYRKINQLKREAVICNLFNRYIECGRIANANITGVDRFILNIRHTKIIPLYTQWSHRQINLLYTTKIRKGHLVVYDGNYIYDSKLEKFQNKLNP